MKYKKKDYDLICGAVIAVICLGLLLLLLVALDGSSIGDSEMWNNATMKDLTKYAYCNYGIFL